MNFYQSTLAFAGVIQSFPNSKLVVYVYWDEPNKINTLHFASVELKWDNYPGTKDECDFGYFRRIQNQNFNLALLQKMYMNPS